MHTQRTVWLRWWVLPHQRQPRQRGPIPSELAPGGPFEVSLSGLLMTGFMNLEFTQTQTASTLVLRPLHGALNLFQEKACSGLTFAKFMEESVFSGRGCHTAAFPGDHPQLVQTATGMYSGLGRDACPRTRHQLCPGHTQLTSSPSCGCNHSCSKEVWSHPWERMHFPRCPCWVLLLSRGVILERSRSTFMPSACHNLVVPNCNDDGDDEERFWMSWKLSHKSILRCLPTWHLGVASCQWIHTQNPSVGQAPFLDFKMNDPNFQ